MSIRSRCKPIALATLVATAAPAAQAATLIVTNFADTIAAGDGCTLREAIQASNSGADFSDCTGVGAYAPTRSGSPAAQRSPWLPSWM